MIAVSSSMTSYNKLRKSQYRRNKMKWNETTTAVAAAAAVAAVRDAINQMNKNILEGKMFNRQIILCRKYLFDLTPHKMCKNINNKKQIVQLNLIQPVVCLAIARFTCIQMWFDEATFPSTTFLPCSCCYFVPKCISHSFSFVSFWSFIALTVNIFLSCSSIRFQPFFDTK